MRTVNVNFLRPGQVVADAIKNSSGAVLCPMGYVLTETAIARLKNAGVATVRIEGRADAGPDVNKLEENLEKRFEGIADPGLLRIKRLLQKRYDLIRSEYSGS